MYFQRKKLIKAAVILLSSGLIIVAVVAFILISKTRGRTLIQVDIHQNKKLIHLSTFAEPPQFAIWLENRETKELKTVFVTHRVAIGDWEGKANVPVALPQWFKLFRDNRNHQKESGSEKKSAIAITGATPKEDYFSIRAEVKPGSEWICWIEMNLAGDFNDSFPEFDKGAHKEDEFSNGQPALLFKADIKALEDLKFTPVIEAQSIWEKGVARIEPVSDGITTAKNIFDNIQISVIRPKPKLIDKTTVNDF
jgi:hypothetical protein